MAQQVMHAMLTAKSFPFDYRELSSTIVLNDGLEQNRQLLTGFGGEETVQQFGICQAFQLQNVLPIVRGYSSAHFLPQLESPTNTAAEFDDLIVLQDPAGNVVLYSPAAGQNMIYSPQQEDWIEDPVSFSPDAITVAYLKGETYVCYPGVGLYVYNHTTQTFEQQTVNGVVFTNILGVTAAGGTLILWTKDSLYWSSQTDPLDFTPSQSTGAGTTSVLALRGNIILCKPLSDGFVIYTRNNAVAAQATGSLAFPWNFSEIPDSAGILNVRHVASNDSAGAHVAWTTSGFMEVSFRGAQPVWPELSESVTRGHITRSDASGFPYIVTDTELRVKLNAIGTEYITISVGTQESGKYDVAYVYDLQIGRWGKLDIPHQDFAQFEAPLFVAGKTYAELAVEYPTYFALGEGGTYAKVLTAEAQRLSSAGKNFGVLSPDGSVFSVVLASDAFPTNLNTADPRGYEAAAAKLPTIILGRYKIRRSTGVRAEGFEAEGLRDVDVRMYGHDYVGKRVLEAREIVEHPSVPGKFYGRVVGDSVSVVLQGVFSLTDLSLFLGDAGKRNLPNKSPSGNIVVNGIPVIVDGVRVIL